MSTGSESDDEDVPPYEVNFSVEIPDDQCCAGAAINWIMIRRSFELNVETPLVLKSLINLKIEEVQNTYNSTCSKAAGKELAENKTNNLDMPKVVVPIGLGANGIHAEYHSFGVCAILEGTINSLPAGLYFVSAKAATYGARFCIQSGGPPIPRFQYWGGV